MGVIGAGVGIGKDQVSGALFDYGPGGCLGNPSSLTVLASCLAMAASMALLGKGAGAAAAAVNPAPAAAAAASAAGGSGRERAAEAGVGCPSAPARESAGSPSWRRALRSTESVGASSVSALTSTYLQAGAAAVAAAGWEG